MGNGAVDRLSHFKLELPVMEALLDNLLYAGLLPQASENQVRAYLTDRIVPASNRPCWKSSMRLTCRLKRDSERSRASVAPATIRCQLYQEYIALAEPPLTLPDGFRQVEGTGRDRYLS